MKHIFNRVQRFILINFQYLALPFPIMTKWETIVKTDILIVINLLMSKKRGSITIHKQLIYFDTPFATKTFLSALYDVYIETLKFSILPKKPIIVDVGANIGQFLFAIKSFVPLASVYSIEPDPEIFEILKKNFSNLSHVTLYNFALGAKNSRSTFYKSRQFSEWSSLILPDKKKDFVPISVAVKVGDNQLAKLKAIDLLKIDVEGAEFDVLQGLKKSLKKTKYVLIEISLVRETGGSTNSKSIQFLLDNNFGLIHIGRIFTYAPGEEQGAADLLFKNNAYEENI